MMSLVAKLAKRNIGYIDWEQHIPVMFARFLAAFHLPVCYNKEYLRKRAKMEVTDVALWITSTLVSRKGPWYQNITIKWVFGEELKFLLICIVTRQADTAVRYSYLKKICIINAFREEEVSVRIIWTNF